MVKEKTTLSLVVRVVVGVGLVGVLAFPALYATLGAHLGMECFSDRLLGSARDDCVYTIYSGSSELSWDTKTGAAPLSFMAAVSLYVGIYVIDALVFALMVSPGLYVAGVAGGELGRRAWRQGCEASDEEVEVPT